MNVTELRIGNYIMANGKVINVGHIQDNFYGILINGNGLDTNLYSPIPLTEEWLLKFGFERSGLYHVKDQVYIYDRLGDHDADFEYRFNYTESPMFYVHQLQNLFYCLNGKEFSCD